MIAILNQGGRTQKERAMCAEKEREEIEVTPEMIAAGVRELRSIVLSDTDDADAVRLIYLAMSEFLPAQKNRTGS